MIQKLAQFTDIRAALVVGGLSQGVQAATLRSQPEIVVATPVSPICGHGHKQMSIVPCAHIQYIGVYTGCACVLLIYTTQYIVLAPSDCFKVQEGCITSAQRISIPRWLAVCAARLQD